MAQFDGTAIDPQDKNLAIAFQRVVHNEQITIEYCDTLMLTMEEIIGYTENSFSIFRYPAHTHTRIVFHNLSECIISSLVMSPCLSICVQQNIQKQKKFYSGPHRNNSISIL